MQPLERDAPVVEDLDEPPSRQMRCGLRFEHQSEPGTGQHQRRRKVRVVENELAGGMGADLLAVSLELPREKPATGD